MIKISSNTSGIILRDWRKGNIKKPKKKKKSKKLTRFHEYDKKIGKKHFSVYLSRRSKKMKPHFFRNKRTANKQAEIIKKDRTIHNTRVEPYKKSFVIYFH